MPYPLLLKPIRIGNLTVPNRIVMPPMGIYQANEDGLIKQEHLEHYKCSSGPGLVIVEGAAILAEGRVSSKQLGIYSNRHIEGLTKLAKIIHNNGSLAGIQIMHAGATASVVTRRNKYQRNTIILLKLLKQQLMVSELHRIREAFKNAAHRAVEAGFDIIEIHGAHGKLFSQFLSPLKNWRKDRYGGSLENRSRFLLEVYRQVDQEVAGRALITCRLGVADRYRMGLSLSDGVSTASLLEQEGIEFLDISHGSGVPSHVQPKEIRYSALLHLAHETKSAVKVPVIGGGSVIHPDLAEQALQDNMADLIFVGRGILADPEWARKTMEGKAESIVPCQNCKMCFFYSNSSLCPARRKNNRTIQ